MICRFFTWQIFPRAGQKLTLWKTLPDDFLKIINVQVENISDLRFEILSFKTQQTSIASFSDEIDISKIAVCINF